MNYEQFLKLLAQTRKDHKWSTKYYYNALRSGRYVGCRCPITAVAKKVTGEVFDNSDWASAAVAISLPHQTAYHIVLAADLRFGYSENIREDLLRAAGLLKRKRRQSTD